jgi:hypothetical protein
MQRIKKVQVPLLAAALTMLNTLCVAPTAHAYTVKGMGKCAGWVAGEDDRFWLLGFLSGYNFARSSNVAADVKSEEIYRFVTRYCKERPNDDLGDAITSFIRSN